MLLPTVWTRQPAPAVHRVLQDHHRRARRHPGLPHHVRPAPMASFPCLPREGPRMLLAPWYTKRRLGSMEGVHGLRHCTHPASTQLVGKGHDSSAVPGHSTAPSREPACRLPHCSLWGRPHQCASFLEDCWRGERGFLLVAVSARPAASRSPDPPQPLPAYLLRRMERQWAGGREDGIHLPALRTLS